MKGWTKYTNFRICKGDETIYLDSLADVVEKLQTQVQSVYLSIIHGKTIHGWTVYADEKDYTKEFR